MGRHVDLRAMNQLRNALAREWLWALGSILITLTFLFLVASRAQGQGGGPKNGWQLFFEAFMVGTFWYWIVGVYLAVQFVRLTIWAVRTVVRR